MSGGGAASPGSDVTAHLKDSHGLILLGMDVAGASWPASTKLYAGDDAELAYRYNPSVLRYLLERGLSDAGGNAYDGVSAFDPSGDLADMQDELDSYIESVDALSPDGDVPDWLAVSEASATGDLPALDIDASVATIVANARLNARAVVADAIAAAGTLGLDQLILRTKAGFTARARREHLAGVSQFTGQMADALAVNTSAFVVGLAKLERGYQDRLAGFDTDVIVPITRDGISAFIEAFKTVAGEHLTTKAHVHLQEQQTRSQYIMNATQLIGEQMRLNIGARQSRVDLRKQISSASVAAYNDQYQADLDIDVKNMHWDMEMFQSAGNVISAVSGSVVHGPGKPSRFTSALSGALGGASVGATTGNPWLVGAGAVVGAIAGGTE